jgi:UDP-N-acetylmuramate-alanine ligase
MDIYSSLREKDDPSVSSSKLTQSTNEKSGNAIFLPQPQDVIEYVEQKRFGGDTIIVTMGAGDVYETGYKLVKI